MITGLPAARHRGPGAGVLPLTLATLHGVGRVFTGDRGTDGSNPSPSSGESGEIHGRACGAEVQPHPVHRKPAMKLVPRDA